jgi:hypothetical protein
MLATETSWEMPSVPVPQSLRQPKVVLKESPEPEPVENGVKNGHVKYSPPLARKGIFTYTLICCVFSVVALRLLFSRYVIFEFDIIIM